MRFIDPTGMEPEDGPGDPRQINIWAWVMYKSASGWHYRRNSTLDTTGTRIEGTNWHGDEERVYNPYSQKWLSMDAFRKNYSNAKMEGEPLGETLSRGAKFTWAVAKIAATSPETQPILLAPFMEILAAGTVAEASNIGRITNFEKIAAYGIEKETVKQGVKFFANGGTEKAAMVFRNLLKEGYESTLKGSGDAVYYELNKGAEKILFRQSKSGGYSGFDTFVKPLGNGKNTTILFK